VGIYRRSRAVGNGDVICGDRGRKLIGLIGLKIHQAIFTGVSIVVDLFDVPVLLGENVVAGYKSPLVHWA
jgi:hypothetical protein